MQGLHFYTHQGSRVNERYSHEWSIQEWPVDEDSGGDEEEENTTMAWFPHYENDCKWCVKDGCDGSGCHSTW
jgi:hypothetical protein